MIQGVGFSLKELSIAGKLNMTISTMIGVAFGGWVYLRWGTFRSLLIFGIGQALTNLLYMWLALAGRKVWLLALATSLDTMIGGMGQAAFVAFLVSAVLRGFQRDSICAALGSGGAAPECDRCNRGCPRADDRLGQFFRGHLFERGARTDFAGVVARTLKRTHDARGSRRQILGAGLT